VSNGSAPETGRQSKNVAKIVSGVGQQRCPIDHQDIQRFDDDEAEIERDPDRESFAETRRRMDMRVAVIMTVMVMRVAAMIVEHRDRLPLYRRRHREERAMWRSRGRRARRLLDCLASLAMTGFSST
jgi:hypothetical protein